MGERGRSDDDTSALGPRVTPGFLERLARLADDGGMVVTRRVSQLQRDDIATNGEPRSGSRRRPERRDELVSAALDVIRRSGPSASMDEMAAEAGITKPVLYRYFGDRDGLVAAVAERCGDDLVARLDEALSPAPGEAPREVVRRGIETYLAFIEEDQALYGFLTQHAPLEGPALVAVFDRVAACVAGVIRTAAESYGLDALPVATWAYGIVGMVHLAGARWARRPDSPRGQFVADLTALVADGVMGATAAAPNPGPSRQEPPPSGHSTGSRWR